MKERAELIAELRYIKELNTINYFKLIKHNRDMQDPEEIKQNEWDQEYTQGKITGIKMALTMLENA